MASSGAGSSKNKDADGSPFDPFWTWNRDRNQHVVMVDSKGVDNKDVPPSPHAQGSGDDAAATGNEPRRRPVVRHSSQNKKGDDTLKKMVGEQSQQENHPVPTNPELRSKNIHDRPQKTRLVADSKQKRPARFKKPELNVQVALTKQEIEEDLLAMTGMKPSRRPQKRPKELQRLLDVLFPGAGLNGINEDKYRVNESSSRKG